MSRAGTPVVASPQAGVQSRSKGSSSSQPTACAAMKSRSIWSSRHMTCNRAKANAASLPGKGCKCRSAACAVDVRTGSTTITLPGVSRSQCSCAWGAEAEGFAPHTTMQAASRAVRGSKPTNGVPYRYVNATCPALLQIVSGSTSVVPRRKKKRKGKR